MFLNSFWWLLKKVKTTLVATMTEHLDQGLSSIFKQTFLKVCESNSSHIKYCNMFRTDHFKKLWSLPMQQTTSLA